IGHVGLEQALYRDPFQFDGTLAEASLSGGSPRELLEDVSFADWSSDGADLAVVHRQGNRRRMEFPVGTPVYDLESELLNDPRVLGRPGRVAFKDWSRILVKDPGRAAGNFARDEAIEIAWSAPSGE